LDQAKQIHHAIQSPPSVAITFVELAPRATQKIKHPNLKHKFWAADKVGRGGVAYALWLCLLLLITADFIWASHAQITITNWVLVFAVLGVFGIVWLIYGVTGRSARLADMGQYAAAWIIFCLAGSVFSYCTATLRYPLWDAEFVQWDAMLGFHWKSWWDTVIAHPPLVLGLGYFYSSLPVQIFIAIMYFSHFNYADRNRELLWIALLSGVLVSLVSGVMPARGAFEYFGVPKFASHLAVLTTLRESTTHAFVISQMQGIITFPSYHTVMAIYFSYAFRGCGKIFYVILGVNILMLLSVVTHGGHYVVDVIAGAVVVVLVIVSVRVISSIRYRETTQQP
jgi:PAP2 superfamily